MISVEISDNKAGRRAHVTENNALRVEQIESAPPEVGTPSRNTFLSGLLGTTGLDSGTTDHLAADGSVTTYTAYVEASDDYDIRITYLMVVIEDSTVSHSTFGALPALTNGVSVVSIERGEETFVIKEATKFADLIDQTLADAPFGDGTTAFELASTTGTQDSQVLPMNIGAIIPGGIRIGRGTVDRLELRINDNLTGLSKFTVRVLGYRVYAD